MFQAGAMAFVDAVLPNRPLIDKGNILAIKHHS
jgi:hypothetical protein